METCMVVEFIKSAPPYHFKERAGFDAERAALYIKHGFAKMVGENVPRIDPNILANEMLRQIEEWRARIAGAQRMAKAVQSDPTATTTAAEALAQARQASAAIDALAAQLAAAGQLPMENGRKPGAAARAT
jgi:hypothetical protein